MPAQSEKQARLFRAALGNPTPGTGAAKIKASVPREKIKHFTKVGEGTSETLGMTEEKASKLKEIIRSIVQEVLKENDFSK
jgi:hypothetical protein